MHSIADIIASRTDATLADLLLAMYTAGYDAALGDVALPDESARADLIELVAARHRDEVLSRRDGAVAIPAWLSRLANERVVGT